MTLWRDRPKRRVPTLTEVISPLTAVDLLLDVPGALPQSDPHSMVSAPMAETSLPFTLATVPSISALLATVEGALPAGAEPSSAARVVADVRRELDVTLEAHLRDVLAPLLQQAAEKAIRETHEKLAASLHQMIERAVAQELARHRDDALPRSG